MPELVKPFTMTRNRYLTQISLSKMGFTSSYTQEIRDLNTVRSRYSNKIVKSLSHCPIVHACPK